MRASTLTLVAGLLLLPLVLGANLARCTLPGEPRVELMSRPGFAEPHTPGSDSPLEMPATPALLRLLGPHPDLNRVDSLRVFLPKAGGAPPRAILILVPGFLAGATSLELLARQLVARMNGQLEVWIVDRRPNSLEDRVGALHAAIGTHRAIAEGFQFYFPEQDRPPLGNFPGPEDADYDGDGVLDPQLALPDRFGVSRTFVHLSQDDLRFAAHWGVDTYVRDWRLLVDEARARVGPNGLVLFGGHSMGTTWTGLFAAYDFDPGPGVDPGYAHVDGLLLLEGGGPPAPAPDRPSLTEYRAAVQALATPGGPDVVLGSLSGIDPVALGAASEVAGVAARRFPDEPALAQQTPVFAGSALALFFSVPATNRALLALFLDDDFQPFTAFRASLGFSDDGPNLYLPAAPPLLGDAIYLAQPRPDGAPRGWRDFDDPGLPSCPPAQVNVSPGCALLDNGPRPAPDAPPRRWGWEREVTDLDDLLALLSGPTNFVEWYFVSGRTNLDLAFGRDSSSLGDESVLAVTRNAEVDVPVLCIGGSNGLTPTEASFASYLGSIATPPQDQRIVILEGYAHVDVAAAKQNEAVPVIVDWVNELLIRKLLAAP